MNLNLFKFAVLSFVAFFFVQFYCDLNLVSCRAAWAATKAKPISLCVESPMVSAGSQVSLLKKHEGHSPGQLFSLSLVEAKDGWSTFPLSRAGELIQ